jgi:hypothetical protein
MGQLLLSRPKQPHRGLARLFEAVYGSSGLLLAFQQSLHSVNYFLRSQLGNLGPKALCGRTNKLTDYFRSSAVPDGQLGTVTLITEPDEKVASLEHSAQLNYLPSAI